MSLEFIGVLPFLFLFLILLWQVVASGIAIFQTYDAVNEAAQVYAVSQSEWEAENTAADVIGSGELIDYNGLSISAPDTDGDFVAEINVNLDLIFLPDDWTNTNVPFNLSVNGRVMQW